MSTALQVMAMLLMVVLSYFSLTAFGPRRPSLGFTRTEKDSWDTLVRGPIGTYFILTAAVGGFVGLANPFIFFVGSAKAFGIAIFATCVTIALSPLFTNWVTRRVREYPQVEEMLDRPDQTGAAVASIFWGESKDEQQLATVVKYFSLINVTALIWLEFSVFAELARHLLPISSLAAAALLMAVAVGVVVFFTVRYGIRGFVFVDAIQSPVMLMAILALLAGAIYLVATDASSAHRQELGLLWEPAVGGTAAVIFVLHVIVLNQFQVALTEPHWIRLWSFRDKEITRQWPSAIATAVVWLCLIAIGFATFLYTNEVGDSAFAKLLTRLYAYSPAFIALFWMGAISAMFSTADVQVYSFMVVKAFRPDTGKVERLTITKGHAAVEAIGAGIVLGLAYYGIARLGIPVAKVLFACVPFSLNLLPAFVAKAVKRRPSAELLILSAVIYATVVGYGFAQPRTSFDITLCAAFVPLIVTVLVFIPRYSSPPAVSLPRQSDVAVEPARR